jgi:sporulation protein YlmC with PRC-barrel domain
MGANTLIGNDVYDHNDEELGEIKEIILSILSGKVTNLHRKIGKLHLRPCGSIRR